MAVPKKRVSRTRRDKRRSNVWKLDAPAFSRCEHCGELKLAHRVCKVCGYYKGKEIIVHKERA
ncbi:MAG: 50S ribosomal protein L32 [Oscillospiraceae bacterium]|nr:50S ribosomal protein L32 [Oscillospiraceae bacterium]